MGPADAVRVLDGGLSNALEDRGVDLSSRWWTAQVLHDDPAQVRAVHREYFAAGADVATTASYQASVPSLVAAGLERAEVERLLARSVEVALEAREEARASGVRRELLVAASVGPYGAVLADGSEYRGRYGITPAALRDFHGPRLEVLAAAGPDLVAVETVPDADEAEVLIALLDEVGLPAWFSYSVDGDRTRAGQPLADAYAVLAGSTALVAVGVNCSAPRDVPGALDAARAATGLPGIVYPNRGERWDSATRTWTGEDEFDADLVPSWLAAGARWVGGCCRVGPDDIARVRAVVG